MKRLILSFMLVCFVAVSFLVDSEAQEIGIVETSYYIHQVLAYDPSVYAGHNGCGPNSAYMLLLEHNLLQPNLTWYQMYSEYTDLRKFQYSKSSRDWTLTAHPHWVKGIHGFIVKEVPSGSNYWGTDSGEMVKLLSQHGLQVIPIPSTTGTTDYQTLFPHIKRMINSGLPMIGHVQVYPGDYGHYLVIKGYSEPNSVIVNDPYGNAQGTWNGTTSGENVTYDLSRSSGKRAQLDRIYCLYPVGIFPNYPGWQGEANSGVSASFVQVWNEVFGHPYGQGRGGSVYVYPLWNTDLLAQDFRQDNPNIPVSQRFNDSGESMLVFSPKRNKAFWVYPGMVVMASDGSACVNYQGCGVTAVFCLDENWKWRPFYEGAVFLDMDYDWTEIVAMPTEIMDYFTMGGKYYLSSHPIARISRKLSDIQGGVSIAIATVDYDDVPADFIDEDEESDNTVPGTPSDPILEQPSDYVLRSFKPGEIPVSTYLFQDHVERYQQKYLTTKPWERPFGNVQAVGVQTAADPELDSGLLVVGLDANELWYYQGKTVKTVLVIPTEQVNEGRIGYDYRLWFRAGMSFAPQNLTGQAKIYLARAGGSEYPTSWPGLYEPVCLSAPDVTAGAFANYGSPVFTLPRNCPGSAPGSPSQYVVVVEFEGLYQRFYKGQNYTCGPLCLGQVWLEYMTSAKLVAYQAYVDSVEQAQAEAEAEARRKAEEEARKQAERYAFISACDEPVWFPLGCGQQVKITSYTKYEGSGAVWFAINTTLRDQDTKRAGAYTWLASALDLAYYENFGAFTLWFYKADDVPKKVDYVSFIWGTDLGNYWVATVPTPIYDNRWVKLNFPWKGAGKVGQPLASDIKLAGLEVSSFNFHGIHSGISFDDIRFEKPEKINHAPEFVDFPSDQRAYLRDIIEVVIKGKDADGDALTLSIHPDFPLSGAKIELLESGDVYVWKLSFSPDKPGALRVRLILDDGQL